jgi:hypothetical protein
MVHIVNGNIVSDEEYARMNKGPNTTPLPNAWANNRNYTTSTPQAQPTLPRQNMIPQQVSRFCYQ